MAIIKKFNNHQFKTIYISWNTDPLGDIYILHVASCKPDKWQNLSSLNKKESKEFAPGLQRQRLHSKLNLKSDRVIIKSFDKLLED